MQFLNVLLLGGTAAGAIPLLIHLLQRNKRTTVPWAAMQFLVPRDLQQRRRLRLEQWLLLMLRVLIPVVLGICMARPLLTGVPPSHSRTPTSLVVLLDDSTSMGARTQRSHPAARAANAVAELLNGLPRGSEVSILPMSEPELPLVELTADTAGALDKHARYQPPPAQSKPTASLEAAATQLQKAHHSRRWIVVLTDFQKSNWPEEEAAMRSRVLERLKSQTPTPLITFFDAGASSTENTAVDSLAFTELPMGVGQRVHFVATFKNYGKRIYPNFGIRWKIDSVVRSNSTVSLGANESLQASFDYSFDQAGEHVLEVTSDPDDYPADNVLSASLTIQNPVPVLLINGRASSEPLQGETDFLEIALQPALSKKSEATSLLSPKVIEASALTQKSLSAQTLVVLADTRILAKDQISLLEEFVRKGGGLLFFPGRQTDVEWTNKVFHNEGKGLLPARIEQLQRAPRSAEGESISIAKTLTPHPILHPFLQAQGAFEELKIQSWYSLRSSQVQGAGPHNESANSILSLENGEPLFVERPFGRGMVIQSAIPCGSQWSNLTARPAYVPLMQRLCLYGAAASQPKRTLEAGVPLVESLPSKYLNLTCTLQLPDGTTKQLSTRKEKEGAVVEYADTRMPGTYQLTLPGGEVRKFVFNPSRRESDPVRLEASEIEFLAHACGAEVAGDAPSLIQMGRPAAEGREIWQPLLWLTLLLVFGEMLLLRRFSNQKAVVR